MVARDDGRLACFGCMEPVEAGEGVVWIGELGPFCDEECRDSWREEQRRPVPQRLAAVETILRSHGKRLERGAQTFAAMKPKDWTPRRLLTWVFGPGVFVLGLIGGFAIWLLQLRDTTRDAVKSAESASGAVHSLKADMGQMEARQRETAAALKAVSDGQFELVKRIDAVLMGRRPRKDDE